MPGRKYTAASSSYRYGFNGKENDKNISVGSLDFGARVFENRLGRWLSTDLITKPFITPYNYSSNNPVNYLDPNGQDNIHFYYIITRTYVDGKLMNAKPTKFSVIERNSEPNVFIHHKVELRYDGIGASSKGSVSKQVDTRFYPDVPGESSGLTTSYDFLKIKDSDRKTLIKFIDEYSLSKQDADVNFTEVSSPGSSGSSRLKKAQWWGSVFAEKKFQEEKDKDEKAQRDIVINGVLILGGELLLAGRAVEGALILEKGAFEKLVTHGFRSGRNADLGFSAEIGSVKVVNFITENQSKLKEGTNYFLGRINGIQKSIVVDKKGDAKRSINIFGKTNRVNDANNSANIIKVGPVNW